MPWQASLIIKHIVSWASRLISNDSAVKTCCGLTEQYQESAAEDFSISGNQQERNLSLSFGDDKNGV